MVSDHSFEDLIKLSFYLKASGLDIEEKKKTSHEILAMVKARMEPFLSMGRKAPQGFFLSCKTWVFPGILEFKEIESNIKDAFLAEIKCAYQVRDASVTTF